MTRKELVFIPARSKSFYSSIEMKDMKSVSLSWEIEKLNFSELHYGIVLSAHIVVYIER